MLTEILLDRFPISATTSAGRSLRTQESTPSSNSSGQVSPATKLELSKEGVEKSRAENGKELSEDEQNEVKDLRKRDREVRQHEQAHMAAAGGYALGGPKYEFQNGPDGKRYAVGGHVNLDTSEEHSPEATLRKAMVLQKAATAAAEPSGQDRAVAAQAVQMAAQARKEILEEKQPGNNQAVNAYASSKTLGQESSFRSWMA